MPAVVTHHYFAMQTLKKAQTHIIQAAKDNISAYRLGLQGPDFLYFDSFISKNKLSILGTDIHNLKTAEFFQNMCKFAYENQSQELNAYILGFSSHYILDRNAHPYINVISHEILSENYAGDENKLHMLCESELDSIIIEKYISQDSKTFKSYSLLETLKHPIIAEMWIYAAWETFGVKINTRQIKSAIKSMRSAYVFLHDETGKKMREIEKLERIISSSNGIISSLVRPLERLEEDIANIGHKLYNKSTLSFFDILDETYVKSARLMEHVYKSCRTGVTLENELFLLNYLGDKL